jgi:hypothetical protein
VDASNATPKSELRILAKIGRLMGGVNRCRHASRLV